MLQCSHIARHKTTNRKQYNLKINFILQVRPVSQENVAAHAEVLRGGEEREGPGGGARQKGAAVQTTGSESESCVAHHVITLR